MNRSIIHFKIMGDERGSLIALEANRNIPFLIKRVYYIFGTREDVHRGLHAHKKLHQVLICTSGRCKIKLDDGFTTEEILMKDPSIGLYIGPAIWREMYDFSPDCVLMVLADDYYNEQDYIRDYAAFKDYVHKNLIKG